MTPRTFVSSAAVALLTGTVLALNGVTLGPTPTSPPPTPCEVRRIDLSHPDLADHIIGCAAADATATAFIHVQVTATPCDPRAEQNVTPIPSDGLRARLMAPCAVVAHNATSDTYAATVTAGIIDGSYYGLHISNGAPNWTPTVYPYGTVPPDVLAGYPLTLTAIPWETPHGWCLREDRWVTTCGSLR